MNRLHPIGLHSIGLHFIGDVVRDRYSVQSALETHNEQTTYVVDDLHTGRRVALKAISLQQAIHWESLDQCVQEARVLATLNHPRVPAYYDFFYVDTPGDRCFYLVHQLIRAKSLAALGDRGWRANEFHARTIAHQVLDILCYLQSLTLPIVHRDITPQSIRYSVMSQAYLTEFGSAQRLHDSMNSLGLAGLHSADYAAPELLEDRGDQTSDLYSLGATLVFGLTGRSPATLDSRPHRPRLRHHLPVSAPFATWLETLLEPAIAHRFPSAQAALEALTHSPRQGPNERPLVIS